MLKAYKYRIYPTEQQIVLIQKHFDCCRFVYNLALETKIYTYKAYGKNLTCFDLCYQLPDLKLDHKWLREVNAQSLQDSIKNMDRAYKNFYNGSSYPKFKSKTNQKSFKAIQSVSINDSFISIPKIQNIPIVLSRKFEGEIKAATISKSPTGKYFASILIENQTQLPVVTNPEISKTIGVDLGLTHFLITSNGLKIDNPKHFKGSIERLKVLQRRASKKKKGSANKRKANLKVALLHEKIANKRNDFLQKLSTNLVRDNQATSFCFEKLAVSNLLKNHNLSQAISDISWSEFCRIMKYKCSWHGKNFIQIGRFEPSSKLCSSCGNKNESLPLNVREWNCQNCGAIHDRDINAAINIKNIGFSGLGKSVESVELRTVVRTKKQKANKISTSPTPNK